MVRLAALRLAAGGGTRAGVVASRRSTPVWRSVTTRTGKVISAMTHSDRPISSGTYSANMVSVLPGAPERAAPAVWSGSASACGHNADNEGHDEPRHGDERGNAEDQAKIWAVTLREVPMVHGVRRRLSQRWRILRHANPPGTRCPELSGFRAAGRGCQPPLIPEHHLFAANRIVANGLQREA